MKKFLEWIGLKERLDNNKHKPPHVSEGDIWWASIGENVGSEVNGKSKLFSRPVIILKNLLTVFILLFLPPLKYEREAGTYHFGNKKKI